MERDSAESVRKYYVRRAGEKDIIGAFRPRFLDFHRLNMTGHYLYPEHRHREYEVIWVEQGPYRCRLSGSEISLEDGQILIVKPGDRHQDILCRGQSHYVLHFSLNSPLFKAGCPPEGQAISRRIPSIPPLFERMEEESRVGDSFSGAIQDAVLEQFFWSIIRRIPREYLSAEVIGYSRREAFIRSLFRIFELRCREDLSMDSLAGEMGLSRRTLSNRCREYLDDSPGRLFLSFRIKKACEHLGNGDSSVKETARYFGFDSPYNFSRSFSRIMGICPSRYGKESPEGESGGI